MFKTKIVLTAILLVFAVSANATGAVPTHNKNKQHQGQKQTQQQGQVQGQQQKATADNAGNEQKVIVEGDKVADIPVNSAYAPPIFAVAQCAMGVSGGVTLGDLSIAGGKSYESGPCNTRALIALLLEQRQNLAALEVTCTLQGAELTTICKKLKEKQKAEAPAEETPNAQDSVVEPTDASTAFPGH